MPYVTIQGGPKTDEVLRSKGVRIPGLTGERMIQEESWFEPPVTIQASIPSYTFLQIGAFTSISGGTIGDVSIGRYCAIAPEVIIGAHEHPTDWLTVSRISHVRGLHEWDAFLKPNEIDRARDSVMPFNGSTARTTIGHDVWIGQRVFIRSGVTVGDGAIIGSCAVVTRDVPAYSIVVGSPAVTKRLRFPEQTVERLLKLQWWRYSLYDFDHLPYDSIDNSLDAIEAQIEERKISPYQPEPVRAVDLTAL